MSNKRTIGLMFVVAMSLVGTARAAGWEYIEEKDEMRGVMNKWAVLISNNEEDLGAYRTTMGRLRLDIRSMPKQHGLDVIFSVEKGQIQCLYNGCKIPMKFDDGPIVTYTADRAESRHDSIFLREKEGFIKRAKKAKSIIVEIPVWRKGSKQFTFSPAGLEWK